MKKNYHEPIIEIIEVDDTNITMSLEVTFQENVSGDRSTTWGNLK